MSSGASQSAASAADSLPVMVPAPAALPADTLDAVEVVLNDLGTRAADEEDVAEDVLASVMLSHFGRRVKTDQEMQQGLGEVVARRKRYIKQLAQERGVAQPASGASQWTVRQWEEWFTAHPLGKEDMQNGVAAWRDDFAEHDLRRIQDVRQLQAQDTRKSKADARRIIRGAFNSTLASYCEHSQLAYHF